MLLQISAGVNVGLWVQIGNNRQGVNKKVCATCASVLVAICILLHWVCIYKVKGADWEQGQPSCL